MKIGQMHHDASFFEQLLGTMAACPQLSGGDVKPANMLQDVVLATELILAVGTSELAGFLVLDDGEMGRRWRVELPLVPLQGSDMTELLVAMAAFELFITG